MAAQGQFFVGLLDVGGLRDPDPAASRYPAAGTCMHIDLPKEALERRPRPAPAERAEPDAAAPRPAPPERAEPDAAAPRPAPPAPVAIAFVSLAPCASSGSRAPLENPPAPRSSAAPTPAGCSLAADNGAGLQPQPHVHQHLRSRRRSTAHAASSSCSDREQEEPRPPARVSLARVAPAAVAPGRSGPSSGVPFPATAEESRALWRLVQGELETSRSRASFALPSPSAAAGAPEAGGFWANARALAILTVGPAAATAVQFGLPYPAIQNRVARALAFGFCGCLGSATNSSVLFAVLARRPPRRVVPSYIALFLLCAPALFAASNAVVDLSAVPFGYALGLLCIVLTNQICARLHARLFARRDASIARSAQAGAGAPPELELEAGVGGAADRALDREAGPADPARAAATFSKLQATNMLIIFVLYAYLFLFSLASSSTAQVLINATNSSVCYLFVLLQLRAFRGSLAAALPHGDAVVLQALTMLLAVRMFRQLSYFKVHSVAVYLVSLASDLLFLLVPVSLLARRVARPLVRRAAALLRRLSTPGVRLDPAPSSSSGPGPRAPAAAASSSPAPRSRLATMAKDIDAAPGPGPGPGPDAEAAPGLVPVDGGGARVEVRPLDFDWTPRPSLEGAGGWELEEDRGAEGAAGPAAASGRASPALLDDREELWVYSIQTGLRSMILWQAVVSWVAAVVFVAAVAVARYGPGAALFPYSPATLDDAACASALTFSLLTAGANGAVVAALHAAAHFFPRLKDRLALTSSWRFLRENAGLLALTFMACTSISFLGLYRQANIYYYVFPDAYPP
eukprot:tig00020903_g15074.t2